MARALLQDGVPFEVREQDLDLSIPLDPDVVYTLRPITSDRSKEIRKRHTRAMPNPRMQQREDVIDWEAVQAELLDYALYGWTGILEGGEPVPCDLIHKQHLPLVIQLALTARAQIGEGAAQRAASFREPAGVL